MSIYTEEQCYGGRDKKHALIHATRIATGEFIERRYTLDAPADGWTECPSLHDLRDPIYAAWSAFDAEMGWADESNEKYPFDVEMIEISS